MSILGDFIKEKRKEMGLTASELSRRANISQPYLSQLETGKNDNPSLDVLEKLAKSFNVQLDEMIGKGFIKVVETGYYHDIKDVIHGPQEERQQSDIFHLLENKETVFYNDKPLKPEDRKNVLDMLKIVLSEYHK